MIFCNGVSKSGTHILTAMLGAMGFAQVGGSLIKRTPFKPMKTTGNTSIEEIFSCGNNRFIHCHMAYRPEIALKVEGHRHILILRDPRNVAVSWMRHRVREGIADEPSPDLLKYMIESGMFGMSVAEYYRWFLPWITDFEVLVVRFERMLQEESEREKMGTYLGVEWDNNYWCTANNNSVTSTNEKSDWREYWDVGVNVAWKKTGGARLTEILGYDDLSS